MSSVASNSRSNEESSLLDSAKPAWTAINLDSYMENRPWVVKCFGKHSKATRQDTLYWMERDGPKIYNIIFQIQLVFTSAYVSLLLLSFYPHMVREATRLEGGSFILLSFLPIYLVLTKYQKAAGNLTMACSIGVHRRPHAVAQVIRERKTNRVIRAMVTMQKLQMVSGSGLSTSEFASQTPMNPNELAEVSKIFASLDTSGDGKIETSELKTILSRLGAPTTQQSLQRITDLLDSNKDGHISKEEFVSFYAKHISFHVGHGLHELAHAMFHQFDQDGSGEITMGEFKSIMDTFNVGFTVDEIGELVNELDEQDDGTIGEHEFLHLLMKNRRMFQKEELPTLE